MNADQLRNAARAIIATAGDVVAWEPHHLQRTMTTLDSFASSGTMPASQLRAAVGGPDGRSRATRDAPPTIAVVSLVGVLEPRAGLLSWLGIGTSVADFTAKLAAAAADPAIASILLLIDSPGGYVTGVPEAAAAMRAARDKKPVVGAVVGVNASAAYWISANASRLVASPSSMVGAIGVYAERISVARRLDRDGVDVAVVSAGKYKHEGHVALPLGDVERAALQQRVDDTFDMFVADVAAGRHVSASAVRSGYGEGRLLSARRAQAQHLIDDIATVDTVVAQLMAGRRDPTPLTALQQQQYEQAIARMRAREARVVLSAQCRELAARVR